MGTAGVWVLGLRSHRAIGAATWAGLILLVVVGGCLGALTVPASAAQAPATPVGGTGACPGTHDSAGFSGQLSLLGGPLPSSVVGGVALTYSYWVQSIESWVGGSEISENCTSQSGTVMADGSGGFSFSTAIPGESCVPLPPNGEACTTYSGPYGPITVVPLPAPPAGYGLSTVVNGSVFGLTWVADLATVTVAPSGSPVVVSSDAPTPFVAKPYMANGTPSPVRPAFDWSVSGPGWSFVTPPGAKATATVVAAPGAPNSNLTVRASTTIGTNTFQTPDVVLPLTAVSTSLRSGQVNHTAIDTGAALGVTVTARGALGYSYSATVAPGLGLDPTLGRCTSVPDSPTTVSIRCTASIAYPTPGTAQISVLVSNGYSAAAWASPNVTVVPAVTPQLTPSAPAGYVGVPIPLTLTVPPGSGVPPYSTACFAPGTGPAECESSPGPSWTFRPVFSSVANYSTFAWVVDAAGDNRSIPVTVRVLAVPTVTRPTSSLPNVSAGTPVAFSSLLTGGDLPAQVWWNASDQPAPLSNYRVEGDGSLTVGFLARATGPVRVTVTVRDALGTEVESSQTFTVVAGAATSVVSVRGAPAQPTVVGTPMTLEWQALDPANVRVPTFAGGGVLSVDGADGTPALSWVNVSGAGPLSASPEGSFVVPPADWVDGNLTVTFTAVSAGALTVTLGGSGIPGTLPTLSVTSMPDAAHLRLFAPKVATSNDRSNHTFWHVSDRFGNPVPGAFVIVQYLFVGGAVDRSVGVETTPSGGTGVWLNYTLPGPGTTLRVLDAASDVLLGPIVGTAAGTSLVPGGPATVLVAGGAVGLLAALTSVVLRRRGRSAPGPDEEEAALQLAEGRATVVDLVRTAGMARWEEIAGSWGPAAPPHDLADWLASLVADGTILAQPKPSGELEYRLAPPAPDSPHVVVDESALAHAVARREALVQEDEERP